MRRCLVSSSSSVRCSILGENVEQDIFCSCRQVSYVALLASSVGLDEPAVGRFGDSNSLSPGSLPHLILSCAVPLRVLGSRFSVSTFLSCAVGPSRFGM